MHDALAFLKCCESLAFLIRDVAHITPHNFSRCVESLRIFVEASYLGRTIPSHDDDGKKAKKAEDKSSRNQHHAASKSAIKKTPTGSRTGSGPGSMMRRVRSAPHHVRNAATPASGPGSDYDADESDR